jgi:energy-coupling factor transport system ATP-binding protein
MLDPSGRREVLETIQMLNREYGITVLNITHYMNEAALAQRVLVINDGSLLLDGTPDEIFAQRALLESVGLEVPQCAELIYALRKEGVELEGDKISTPEDCAELILRAYAQKHEGRNG